MGRELDRWEGGARADQRTDREDARLTGRRAIAKTTRARSIHS